MISPIPSLALVGALVAASCPAQISSSLRTGSRFGVTVTGNARTVPVGTPIPAPLELAVTHPSYGSARALVEPEPLAFRLHETARTGPRGGANGTLGSTGAAHDLLWTLSGQGRGTLYVDLELLSSTFDQATDFIQLDLGDDGTPEIDLRERFLGNRTSQQFPIDLQGSLTIRLRAQGTGVSMRPNHPGGFTLSASLRVVTAGHPARFVPYGVLCGNAGLTGRDPMVGAEHRIELRVHAFLFPRALFVAGASPARVPIGGSGCTLLVQPVDAAIVPMVGNEGLLSVALPGPLRGSVFVQAFPFDDQNGFAQSTGLEIVFAD